MSRKAVYRITSLLLLICILLLKFRFHIVKSSGTIYIRADGSVDPPTASIFTVDNITYVFTGNVNDSIIVERDNIILDGGVYTLRGTAGGYGIWLTERINVTINNIKIEAFDHGIRLDLSSKTTISRNNITANNGYGILLVKSSNNTISRNNVANNEHGIRLYKSSNNTITGNKITANNRYGIRLYSSTDYNIISENNITENSYGIGLSNSTNSLISRNTISYNSEYGIGLESYSMKNTMVRNDVTANHWFGIQLQSSPNNTIVRNDVTANRWNALQLQSSPNNTVSGNNIRANSRHGIWLSYSDYNHIFGNEVTDNLCGVGLSSSSDYNNIFGNNITEHNLYSYSYGLWFFWSANNNIHHNNFAENSVQVRNDARYRNVWDNDCEGNYWSDYNGTDSDEDGIGDIPYIIDENNTDRYPLINLHWNPCDINHDLVVNMRDVGLSARAFGTEPGDPDWNCHADITGPMPLEPDGQVDMRDIALIARSFGETYP